MIGGGFDFIILKEFAIQILQNLKKLTKNT